MNISFDWGAVIVAGIGAVGSLFVMKNDMRWIRDSVEKLEKSVGKAHSRIDDLVLGRADHARDSDRG